MKKLLLSGVLLALTASVALAGHLNVNYGMGCWSDGTPIAAKTFACTANTGNMMITASFIPTADKADWVGVSGVLDGSTNPGTPLPAWWQLYNTGACRSAALTVSGDFIAAPQVGCVDIFAGAANGGIGAYQTELYPPPAPLNVPAPERFRLKVAYVLIDPIFVAGGAEYYAFRATITNVKTVGTGACAGCLTPLTMVLEQINSIGLTSGDEIIVDPAANACLTWQTGGPGCGATPATNSTWGQVKSLYR